MDVRSYGFKNYSRKLNDLAEGLLKYGLSVEDIDDILADPVGLVKILMRNTPSVYGKIVDESMLREIAFGDYGVVLTYIQACTLLASIKSDFSENSLHDSIPSVEEIESEICNLIDDSMVIETAVFTRHDIISGINLTEEEKKEFIHTEEDEDFFRFDGDVYALSFMSTTDPEESLISGTYELSGDLEVQVIVKSNVVFVREIKV